MHSSEAFQASGSSISPAISSTLSAILLQISVTLSTRIHSSSLRYTRATHSRTSTTHSHLPSQTTTFIQRLLYKLKSNQQPSVIKYLNSTFRHEARREIHFDFRRQVRFFTGNQDDCPPSVTLIYSPPHRTQQPSLYGKKARSTIPRLRQHTLSG